MENKLRLSDYLRLCSDFEKDPQNEEVFQKIQDFLADLEVREYLPLADKQIAVLQILEPINDDFDVAGVCSFLENGKISKGLLAYCTNLENDIPFMGFSYFVVDMAYQHGLYDTIMKVCEKDCNRLFKMVDDAMNVSNIYKIVQTASLFDKESYDKWLNSMKELKNVLETTNLKELLDTLGDDSEGAKEIINQLRDMATEGVRKEFENEAAKFEKAAKLQGESEEDQDLDDEEFEDDDEDDYDEIDEDGDEEDSKVEEIS